ncbi:MAG: GTP pyrophosphokinase family protein [Terriglobia bacterium]
MERAEYLKFRRPYERVLRELVLELEFFREDAVGVNIHSVQHRLKTYESAMKKSARLNLPIAEMQDIAGIRVVAATADEVDVVARFFTRRADSNVLAVQSDQKVDKEDGYRARHLILLFEGSFRRGSAFPALVEVQLLTLLQHTYNYISRAWVYKSERSFSGQWRAEFQKLSSDIAVLDERIASLHKQVVESSGSDDEPLTPFSYQHTVAEFFREHETIENAVDAVQLLIDLQCDTNGKLRTLFGNSDIMALRERFLKLQTQEGRAYAETISVHDFFLVFGRHPRAYAEEILQKYETSK